MAHIFSTPLDTEPLQVEGTVFISETSAPPPHAITLDRLTSEHDFDDSSEGRCNLTALNRFKALLQRGFNTPDNPESGVPRGTWLVIVAESCVVLASRFSSLTCSETAHTVNSNGFRTQHLKRLGR